ncbi:MAG: polyprenyl synthetase family protein, partial [Planctomycetota bacterium]
GRRVGVAFQIQDDVLDLQGDQRVVGKTLGRDLSKGKLTLPLIHHLQHADPEQRERSLRLLDALSETGGAETEPAGGVVDMLERTGSIRSARDDARRLIGEARLALDRLAPSPAGTTLGLLADAVLTRDR